MKKNGFTLIELMIVVAIIGILAAIVIPVMIGKDSADADKIQEDEVEIEAPVEM